MFSQTFRTRTRPSGFDGRPLCEKTQRVGGAFFPAATWPAAALANATRFDFWSCDDDVGA